MEKLRSYTSSNAYLSDRVEDLIRDKEDLIGEKEGLIKDKERLIRDMEGLIMEMANLICRQFSKTMDTEVAWRAFLESVKNAFQVGEAISEEELRPVFQNAWDDCSIFP